VTEADTDEKTNSGREERPENSVEDRPAMHGSRKHGPRLDVPRIIETHHWLPMPVRVGVQLTTKVVDTFTIPQSVTGALL